MGNYERTVALFLAVVITSLAFLIIRPFIVAILSAAALAYIFYPFYLYVLDRLKHKTAAAIATCAIIVLLVLVPTIFVTTVLTYELRDGYLFLETFITSPGWHLPKLPAPFGGLMGDPTQVKALIGDAAGQLFSWLQGVLKGIPHIFLSIFITVFSTYYFLKHGKDIYNFFMGVFPLPKGRHGQILKRFDDLSRGMVLGQIVVGGAQGLLAWAAFWFLGVPNPVLWGFFTFLISIIPLLGAALVWVPICIYLFISGYLTGEYWRAVTLLLYGTFVISLIDNVLKPKIVGEHAKIHPLVILFGILGGIQLFGIPGILIGPLVLTLFDLMIEIYRETL
ncbi:MAG: AI-2E family transporter [Candidatus Margulisiibacteriota bacterium]